MEALAKRGYLYARERRALKDRLWQERPHVCWLCEQPLTKQEATLDHVRPQVEGGTCEPENLEFAHQRCNQERGSMPAEHYRDILRLRREA